MEESIKPGDIIWQQRMPGGFCLVVQVFEDRDEYRRWNHHGECFWTDTDWPVLKVLHPDEGLFDDPSYYYDADVFRVTPC